MFISFLSLSSYSSKLQLQLCYGLITVTVGVAATVMWTVATFFFTFAIINSFYKEKQ